MKTDKPNFKSGKTYYNRIKQKGESWVALRDKANLKEANEKQAVKI